MPEPLSTSTDGIPSPTIKDVARAAGVHFTTVSMALRSHPRIPAATRERVLAAAARIGYQRNEVYTALSLRRKSTLSPAVRPTLAYVTNQSEANGLFKTAHQRRLIQGAKSQAEALGYHFKLLTVDAGAHDSHSLLNVLRTECIRGVILGTVQPDRLPIDLPWDEFHLVRIDSRHVTARGAFISNDQWHCVRLAHDRLRALGYRRVGLAVGTADEDGTGGLHLAAWLVEQNAVPAAQRVPALLFPHRASHLDVANLLREWVTRHNIDAVACNWSNIRRLLRAAGFSVPRELACACLCLSHGLPGLAGVISQLGQVGKGAVTLLVNLLHGGQDTSTPTLSYVEGSWHAGASAPARRG